MNKYLIYGIIGLILVLVIYWFTTKNNLESSKIKELLTEEETEKKSTSTKGKVKVMNFNTSWCKYSVMFATEWAKFQEMTKDLSNVETIDVKCDDPKNEKICDNYQVPGFPTILFEYDNNLEEYGGERSAEAVFAKLMDIIKT